MARVASKSKTKVPAGSPPTKKLGRPPGSKNRVKAEPARKIAAAPVSKKAASSKAAPSTVKMSKAELEAHVVKLERSLAAARKRVAELKLAASDAFTRGEQAAREEAAEQPAAKIPRKAPVKASGRPRRSRPDAQVLDEATGEAETEAHAS